MSNFWQRAITGTLFVAVIIAAIIFNAWLFHFIFGLVGILGLNEFYTLFKNTETKPNRIIGLIIGTIIYGVGVSIIYYPGISMALLMGVILLSFGAVALAELYRKKERPFENMAITLVGIPYLILPVALLNTMIRFDHETGTITEFWPVLSIFILVWCSDTFAYLVGRQIGKRKLFERISPKKSWEGFFGGLVFAVLGGMIIAWATEASFIEYAVYGLVISSVGTMGDLVESMLKRSVNVKDSGNILPGHGGILDRFDAVLFVIPFIYFLNTFVF